MSKDIASGSSNGDQDLEEEAEQQFCTFAITGDQPAFQAIFVCNECTIPTETTEAVEDEEGQASAQTTPLCICQACADICHGDDEGNETDGYGLFHDVDYIGMGPSTCDCHRMGNCKIYKKSTEEAERLGIRQKADHQSPPTTQQEDMENKSPSDMIKDVYDVGFLQDATITDMLVKYAQELIRHSKETFWVDNTLINSGKRLCPLEMLAWRIYQTHCQRYSIDQQRANRGGAEWWVQIKYTNDATTSSSSCGIDLHYDKDEALAESFGLGSFPDLSTVTYLTAASPQSPPTVVLDHTYSQGEDEVMSQLFVSRPRLGKHLVFDGRLLHGAPYHSKLQPLQAPTEHHHDQSRVRVTFLVNIWKNQRPASIEVLDDKIRQSIIEVSETGTGTPVTTIPDELEMTPLTISVVEINSEDQLPEELQQRIELPFVSDKGAIFDNNEEEENSGLVVVTFPPPPTDDSILVQFGSGMQACLENLQQVEDEDDDAGNMGSNFDEGQLPKQQSDYV